MEVVTSNPNSPYGLGTHMSYFTTKTVIIFDSESAARKALSEGDMRNAFDNGRGVEIVDAQWLSLGEDAVREHCFPNGYGRGPSHGHYVAVNGDDVFCYWEGSGFGGYSGGTERGFRPISEKRRLLTFPSKADAEQHGQPMKLVKFLVSRDKS